MHVTPHAGGTYVDLDVRTPEQRDADRPFRPTYLMERISEALEKSGPLTLNSLKKAVKGDDHAKGLGVDLPRQRGLHRRRPPRAEAHPPDASPLPSRHDRCAEVNRCEPMCAHRCADVWGL